MGQGNQHQSQDAARAPITSQSGQMGQGMRQGPGQGSQVWTSRTQGCVYAITPQIELADQSVIQGTVLLSLLWARVLFDSGASHSFIVTSCVKDLGLQVETLEEPLHVSSPLGTRMNVDQLCQGCELEISGILLTF